jgi:hypothetical protein
MELVIIQTPLYLREEGCEDPWLFFKARMGPQAKTFGKHCSNSMIEPMANWSKNGNEILCSIERAKFLE